MRAVEAGARTRLVEGLPDLGRLFDGLDLPTPSPLGDAGMERTRLFEAVCRLFDRLTRQQPVLLAVDDLQWQIQPQSPCCCTWYAAWATAESFSLARRSGEVSDELDALLSALRRSGLLTEQEVGYLDPAGVRGLARGLLADEPPSTLVELLVERTGGLPLFVRALVRTLLDSGRLFRSGERWVLGQDSVDDVPPEVAALLRSRIDSCPRRIGWSSTPSRWPVARSSTPCWPHSARVRRSCWAACNALATRACSSKTSAMAGSATR